MDNQNNNQHHNMDNQHHNMDNQNMHSYGDGKKPCHGMMFCPEHSNYKHMFLRGIILFIILCFVFWMGKQVGEFKADYKGYDNSYYGHMNGYRMMNDYDDAYRYNMMNYRKGTEGSSGCLKIQADTTYGSGVTNPTGGWQNVQGGMMRQ